MKKVKEMIRTGLGKEKRNLTAEGGRQKGKHWNMMTF